MNLCYLIRININPYFSEMGRKGTEFFTNLFKFGSIKKQCSLCLWYMAYKYYIPGIILVLMGFSSGAQVHDTLRVMHYNLLNYRNTTSYCTEQNNNSDKKDGQLKIILKHVKPDIFTVNEMGANWLNPSKILANALNTDGETAYKQAEFASNGSSSLANMLFFNSAKLGLHSQSAINKDKNGFRLVRSLDLYRLFYKDPIALSKGDTTFILVVVVHLKAGSGSSDKSSRAQQTKALMDYFNENNERINYILCGDLNIRSASESSYQSLTKHSNANIRFYDPVDLPATWNNSSTYSSLHSQSTRTSSNGCASGGGMDDRFDFILCGNEVLMNDYHLQYVDGSYRALGQDSKRFNGSINSPTNTSVSKQVADALLNTSDHLPILMDLRVRTQAVSARLMEPLKWSVPNPVENELNIEAQFQIRSISIHAIDGSKVFESSAENGYEVRYSLPQIKAGMYILTAQSASGSTAQKKIYVLQ
jgi:exonuclease III